MTLKYAGPGCDVCGFGTVENIDEFDPRFPCPECGTVAVTLEERIETLGKRLCFGPSKSGFYIEKASQKTGPNGWRTWWIKGGIEGDSVLPGTAGAKTVDEAVELAEGWFSDHGQCKT